jgi:lipopolysaccharide transport system permease protein
MTCFRMLLRHRQLVWRLTVLDFQVRYAGSRLGLLWMLLSPLLVLGTYLLLFGKILGVRPDPAVSGLDYSLLLACGLLPWLGFSEGVMRGTGSVLAQRNLMKSTVFPMELIPVTAVFAGLVVQLCGLVLLLLVVGARGMLGLAVVLLPPLVLVQALFTIGIVWFLSCVNILYRDTSQVIGLLMVLLMFLSPIAYTQAMVPAGFELLVILNPLSYLIDGYRQVLLFNRLPSVAGLATFAGLAFLTLLAGYRYFMRLRRVLPDYV